MHYGAASGILARGYSDLSHEIKRKIGGSSDSGTKSLVRNRTKNRSEKNSEFWHEVVPEASKTATLV